MIYPISIKTILRNFWKRFVFTLIFLSIPVIFSTILPGCNPGNPELEIIGQEIIVLEEGSYSDVLIYVAYTLKELSDNFPFYYCDFVFSDADKYWYTQYFKDVDPKLKIGGCFTTHNVRNNFGGVKEFFNERAIGVL